MRQILGDFDIVDYTASEKQPVNFGRPQARAFLRIALPVWRMPRARKESPVEDSSLTRDEVTTIFGMDLVSRRISRLHLTEDERDQLDASEKLRGAVFSVKK